MNSKKYTLDFMIPQGPTGPTDPALINIPGLFSYGGRYNYNPNTLSLKANTEEQVPLYDFVVPRKADYTELSSIIIEESGTYEITYVLTVSVPSNAILTATVRENGNNIFSTISTKKLEAGVSSVFCINTIYTLQKGSVIDLALSSNIDVDVSISNNVSLMLKEID